MFNLTTNLIFLYKKVGYTWHTGMLSLIMSRHVLIGCDLCGSHGSSLGSMLVGNWHKVNCSFSAIKLAHVYCHGCQQCIGTMLDTNFVLASINDWIRLQSFVEPTDPTTLHVIASWTSRASSSLAWWMWTTQLCCMLYLLVDNELIIHIATLLIDFWYNMTHVQSVKQQYIHLVLRSNTQLNFASMMVGLVGNFYQRVMLDSSDGLSSSMSTRRMILEQQL